jgi:hypothetical protein
LQYGTDLMKGSIASAILAALLYGIAVVLSISLGS